MNLTDRIYLDYNATSPLSVGFSLALASGEVSFSNPSSQHSSGKSSRAKINKISRALFDFFSVDETAFSVLYHSGATEGINTFLNPKTDDVIVYFESDHPAVIACAEGRSKNSIALKPNSDGSLDLEALIKVINNIKTTGEVWLNFTHVHNETGVIWDLEYIKEIKKRTKCFVHVDAVQLLGKTDSWVLVPDADVYTFSAHKFGALKGIGFSFYKKSLRLEALILGGGQQSLLRSGTENIQGIESIFYAIEDFKKDFLPEKLKELKSKVETILNREEQVNLIKNQSLNTICFTHQCLASDIMLIHLDLLGLDVSSGSACSSGSLGPSKTLLSMGMNDLASKSIRISIGVNSWKKEHEILSRLEQFIQKIKK